MNSPAKQGRFKQSVAYWCLNATEWRWDIQQICATASRIGYPSVELVPHDLWPVVRQHGLQNALAHNGMPDPVFVKGLNNPRYQEEVIARTKQTIDQCADSGVPNVIAFTGFKWLDAEDPSSGEISSVQGAEDTVKG